VSTVIIIICNSMGISGVTVGITDIKRYCSDLLCYFDLEHDWNMFLCKCSGNYAQRI